MRTRLSLLVICFVVLGGSLFALWFSAHNSRPQKSKDVVASTSVSAKTVAAANSSVPFSLDDIPIYPGAQNVQKPSDPTLGGHWVATEFETNGAIKDIAQFYKEALPITPTTGWDGSIGQTNSRSLLLEYSWSDPQDKVPYWLALSIQILDMGELGNNKQSVRNVHISFLRISDLTKIPAYPGATQLKVQYLPSGDQYGYGTRVTSYVTKANLSELKQFYTSSLVKLGYDLVEDATATNNDSSFTFKYQEIGPGGLILRGEVAVTATSDQLGETQVDLRVRGSTIVDELYKVQK